MKNMGHGEFDIFRYCKNQEFNIACRNIIGGHKK
jgi:hypothetical protein